MDDVHPLFVRSVRNPALIDLEAGAPGFSVVPSAALARAAQRALTAPAASGLAGVTLPPSCLMYGTLAGPPSLREELSTYLNAEFEGCDGFVPCAPADLCITSGCSQALDTLCSRLCRPGDTVLAERITYFLCQTIFEDHGLKVIPVEVTPQDGIDLDDLAAKMEKHRPRMLYVIPVFQNPLGSTLSHERRLRLVSLARAHSCAVVADEAYSLLWYDPGHRPPAPLCCYDQGEGDWPGVVSVSSFSKTVCPGLRVGWIQARRASLIEAITKAGFLFSGGGLNPMGSATVCEMMRTGDFATHVAAYRAQLKQAAASVMAALRQLFGEEVQFTEPYGGFYIWATFSGAAGKALSGDRAVLVSALEAEGVAIKRGDLCLLRDSEPDKAGVATISAAGRSMRLCVGYAEPSKMAEGISRIKSGLVAVLQQ